ncbi:hypothetical protein M0651_07710 [Paenibacillus sp. MBLB2552]|uniref:Uncharacterized protein n=1 Tax=Paenibacillus mellifer TaxID=2937794 RepID=A0A9X2BPN1_9BACL|nr:hypothetical protein [Paenibacillus mellifer]MCK8487052.1 hypothetical protein [Paenibacillus mellifer]
MNNVNLMVEHLYGCKEAAIQNTFASIGIIAVTNVQEGLVSLSYDSQTVYFVEMIEMLEEHGCAVKQLMK